MIRTPLINASLGRKSQMAATVKVEGCSTLCFLGLLENYNLMYIITW